MSDEPNSTKKFDGNIRVAKILSDGELRDSLKGGWDKELPAIKDERGVVLVGHRRLKIAEEEKIEPVIKIVTFGDGPEAEAARIRLANVSNIGGAPLTVEDRKRQSERLYKSGLTQEAIAHMLGVSQMTVSRDLEDFDLNTTFKSKHRKTKRNPRGSGRPKGGGGRKGTAKPRNQTVDRRELARAVLDHGKTIEATAKAHGVSVQIVKTAISEERGRRNPEGDQEIMVSIHVLIEELSPLIEELREHSKRHFGHIAPAALQILASNFQRALDRWASSDSTVRRVRGHVAPFKRPTKGAT